MQAERDRRVLVVTNEFPPVSNAGVQRPLYFCRYLPAFGWTPVVLTVKDVVHFAYDPTLLDVLPSSVRIVRTESLELRRILWHIRHVAGRDRRRVPARNAAGTVATEQTVTARTRDFGRAFRRWMFVPDDRILWLPFAVASGIRACRAENVEAIYGTVPSYSVGTIAQAISRTTGKPLILDLRDPWTGDPYHQGPTPVHRWLSRKMEASAIRHAHKVVVICEDMKQFFLKRYPDLPESKLAVITNGYDDEEMRAATPILDQGRFTVVYSGALYAHHTQVFEAFCRAWSLACERSASFAGLAQFLAVGRTDPEIRETAGRYPMLRAQFLGPQPHGLALRHLVGGTLLLLVIKNVRRDIHSVITIPGKVFEYVGSRRPILMIGPEGDAARIVRETGRGIVCREEDTSSVADGLLQQFAVFEGQAEQRLPQAADGRYNRKSLAGDLAVQLDQACAEAARRGRSRQSGGL